MHAVLATGAIISGIPLVDRVQENPLEAIETGDFVKVDADSGLVTVIKKKYPKP